MNTVVTTSIAGTASDLSASPRDAQARLSVARSASSVPSPGRNGLMAQLRETASSVNALQQLARPQGIDSAQAPLPAIPPTAPMPVRHAPANPPSDDRGKSNIVFSDDDNDASLIH